MGEPLSVSEYQGVVPRATFAGQMASEDVAAYRVVRPGQLAANVMWLNRSGLGVSHHTGYVSPAYKVFDISDSLSLRFADYLLRSALYRAVFESLGRGVRPNAQMVDTFDLRAMAIPCPPLHEQRAIADFLDRETAKIDALTDKQHGMIDLLRERRTGTIDRAIRRGLDESVQWQDSGDVALGDVPGHWTLCRVKHVARAIIGLTYSPEDVVDEGTDGATLVLRAGNIQQGRLSYEDLVHVRSRIPQHLHSVEGDVLLCARNGSAQLIGKNAEIRGRAVGQTWGAFMAVLRSPLNPYLRWVLNSEFFRSKTGQYATTTINQLTSATLHGLAIALPPLDEQHAIADHLGRQVALIDALIAKAEEFIALAKERRAALITAAVTGQIDVLGEAS